MSLCSLCLIKLVMRGLLILIVAEGSAVNFLRVTDSDRHPQGIYRAGRDGTDGAGRENLFSGRVFVFRGRRGNLIKVLWWDGDGLCLLAKRLERGRFTWPQTTGRVVSLTPAQLSMLREGIDWRHPVRTTQPQIAV